MRERWISIDRACAQTRGNDCVHIGVCTDGVCFVCRVYDAATMSAVKTLQTRYGLPATGTWGPLERMMFDEARIHTDTPVLEALAPAKTRFSTHQVVQSRAELSAYGGASNAVGSAAAGAALGLTAAFAIVAADNVRRGGSATDIVHDAVDNVSALVEKMKIPNIGRLARMASGAVFGARDAEPVYENGEYYDERDERYGRAYENDGGYYDDRRNPRNGDGGSPVPQNFGPGGSESYYGYDAQYHTPRTRQMVAGAVAPVAPAGAPHGSRGSKNVGGMRRGGGGSKAARALAGMDLQQRQQQLVNSPEIEVEQAVAVGASSRPMATLVERVRQGWDAGMDAVGDIIPDGIPLIGNGSDFTARAQRERDLNAKLAEARYYAELEQQKRFKAETAFKQSHQKWLDAQAATREVRAQAAATAAKLGELEEKLFGDEIFSNHPVMNKVTELESLVLENETSKKLESNIAELEVNTFSRVRELEEQVAQLESQLASKPDITPEVLARLEALESALQSGSQYDADASMKRATGLQQDIADVGDALEQLRGGMEDELSRVEAQLNGLRPLMDHGAGRIDLLFAKLTAVENSLTAVSAGASSQIDKLSTQIDRLEALFTETNNVVLEPIRTPGIEEVVPEPQVEEEEVAQFSGAFDVVEDQVLIEEDEHESAADAAQEFFNLFQESQAAAPIFTPQPEPEPVIENIPAPVEEKQILESGVLPRIATGREVMLQGFHWESHNLDWYKIVQDRVGTINKAGFTQVWLPPPADSLAPQGYLPRNLYSLNSAYGSEAALKNLISTCKEYDVLPVLDAVLNHRCATHKGAGDKWNRWEGTGMDWGEWAIDNRNPDFGGQGGSPTGDEFSGAPNIDHTNARVREDLAKWFKWLRNDIGFGGVRFDFSKGYGGQFAGEYIKAMSPEFAVGEYWDTLAYGAGLEYNQDAHRQRIVDWIDAAGGNCTAFDFTTKGILQEACGRSEFWRLIDSKGRAPGVIGLWPARAVTFIDNHDTGSTQGHWPFPHDNVMMGYAYILTHPGTPCVMWDHFFDWGDHMTKNIEMLLAARQRSGVHSRSKLQIIAANDGLYAAVIDNKMAVKLGRDHWQPAGDDWSRVCGDHDWTVWTK